MAADAVPDSRVGVVVVLPLQDEELPPREDDSVVKTLVFVRLLAELGDISFSASSLPQYLQRYLSGDLPERKKIEGAESFSRTETQVERCS